MIGFRSIEDLNFGADEANYQAWKEQLEILYHLLGFEIFGTSVGYNDREYAERYVERHYGNSWREEFESSGR